MLCCAQPCQLVLSQPVANPHSRSIALNRPTFAQRWRDDSALLRAWPFFKGSLCEIEPSLQCAHFTDLIFQKCFETILFLTFWSADRALATVSCAFCRHHLPKVLRGCQFLAYWCANQALATLLRAFCRQLSQIEPRTRGNRDLTAARFHSCIHALTMDLMMTWSWHDEHDDDKTARTFVCNSEISELNFLCWTSFWSLNYDSGASR